jgi:PAS domain S-box-containing protein
LTASGSLALWIVAWLTLPSGAVIDVVGRYLLGLPAIIAVLVGFFRRSELFGNDPRGRRLFWATSIGFAVYACATSISQPGDFFPASVLNYEQFEALTGTPVQLWRMASAGLIAAAVILALDRFDRQEKIQLAKKAKTAAKELEDSLEALRESEARLDGFFANAPVGMAILDDRRKYLKVNDVLASWNGVAPEDHIGKALEEVLPAFERPGNVDYRQLIESGDTVLDMELVAALPSHPDKEMTWLISRFPIPDAKGKPATHGTIAVDITERKRAEVAQRNSEARLLTQYENFPIPTYTWQQVDDDFELVDYNAAASTITKGRIAELIGRSILELYRYDSQIIKDMKRCRAGGKVLRKEMRVPLRSTGEPRDLDVTYVPAQPNLVLVHTEDITERKQAEDEVRQLNAELEQRVEERTKELEAAHRELLQQEKLATLGQLTATVTHELRNPLGVMRSSTYLLQQKVGGGEGKVSAAIERIERNIGRCDRIIDELLDFTRIRPIDFQPLALDAWLGGVLDEMSVADGIEVVRDFATAGIEVQVDAEMLRRLVINLHDNACQAMTEMEGAGDCARRRLTVRTRRDGESAEIVFSDTGVGIPEEARSRLFEPMFSTKGFGVGLGLPVVRKIAEQHGGGIDIVNNPEGGARATLTLPLAAGGRNGDTHVNA